MQPAQPKFVASHCWSGIVSVVSIFDEMAVFSFESMCGDQ